MLTITLADKHEIHHHERMLNGQTLVSSQTYAGTRLHIRSLAVESRYLEVGLSKRGEPLVARGADEH